MRAKKKVCDANIIVYGSIIGESFKSRCPCVKGQHFYCIPTNSTYSVMKEERKKEEKNCLQLCYVVLHHRFDNM